MKNLVDLLVAAARNSPDQVAIDDGERSVTFAELAERAEQLAGGLEVRGAAPGVRVAILSRNRVEYVELTFALFALGAVVLPINWRLRSSEVRFVLEDSGAQLILTEAEFQGLCEEDGSDSQTLDCVVFDEQGAIDNLLDGRPCPLTERAARLDPAAAAVQMYTSGTTGQPKGAMLSQAGFLALVLPWRAETGLDAGDDFLQVTPLFHVGGLLMVLTCVLARARLRTMPEFLPGPALDILEQERIDVALFVPAMVRWLVAESRRRDRLDMSSLRLIIYGAAPMPVPLLEEAMDLFACGFLQGYGLTETAGVVTVLRPEDHRWTMGSPAPARLASAGRAIACTEVQVRDRQGGRILPPSSEVGEVFARGENLMLGYWQRPQELVDGWLPTGDLGRWDSDGFLYLVDRRKDMICVSGENVYPREVEDVLLRHPAVEDGAVIGIPHEHFGEEVLALVVRSETSRDSDEDLLRRQLIQHCRQELARFKCPTRIEFCKELPRNAAGKLLKKELRAPYWQGRERKV